MKSHEFIPPHQSSLPNLSDFFEVVEVTAHEERRGSHDEVQHLTRQDGHKRVLPLQGVEVGHEALSHERQQGPVRGEEHDALFRQDTGQDLGEQEHCLLPVASGKGWMWEAPPPNQRLRFSFLLHPIYKNKVRAA